MENKEKVSNEKTKCKRNYKRKKCEKEKRERCDLAHAENKFAKHFYSFCEKEMEKNDLKS
jgi:hypothetical protein